MTNSLPRDGNHVPTMGAVLNTDQFSIQTVYVDPTTHKLKITFAGTDGTTNTQVAARDANQVPTKIGLSSDDNSTPVPIYATSTGQILVK